MKYFHGYFFFFLSAFTRSCGDLHLQTYGVSCVPDVSVVDLQAMFAQRSTNGNIDPASPALLLVCSDGVWDNWKFQDVSGGIQLQYVSTTVCVKYVVSNMFLCSIRFVSNTFAMEYFCSGNTVAILLCQNTSVSNMFCVLTCSCMFLRNIAIDW